jgi:hypothetical protein
MNSIDSGVKTSELKPEAIIQEQSNDCKDAAESNSEQGAGFRHDRKRDARTKLDSARRVCRTIAALTGPKVIILQLQ